MTIHLHSAGRYGDSLFLVGHYDGSGEIVQNFVGKSLPFIFSLDLNIDAVDCTGWQPFMEE